MTHESIENLENQAQQQREQIHDTATELRMKVSTKVKTAEQALDVTEHLRKNFIVASIVVSSIMFVLGYSLAGLFDSR